MSIYDKSSLVLIPSGTKTGKVYSQKPVSGDGDFTFTRSSAATRVNADGFIEKETQNFLLQSNSFNNSSWLKTGSPIFTSGQSDPFGGNDAWKFESSNAVSTQIYQSALFNTGSIYAKAGNVSSFSIWANLNVTFDLSSGTITSGAANGTIEDVGGGWYRCSIFNPTANVFNPNFTATAAGEFVYIAFSQAEQGLVARDYIETTTTAVEGGITDNVPRLDYTDSSCPALLLEPQRSNIVPHSEYLGSSDWSKTAFGTGVVPVLTFGAESPEGLNNAYEVTFNTGAGTSSGDQSNMTEAIGGQAAGDYTLSFWAKVSSGTDKILARGAGGYLYTTCNLTTEWQRFEITENLATAGSIYIDIGLRRGLANEPLNSSVTCQIYGIQLEAGSYATSYIPTYGSSVTRVPDASSVTGVSSLIGQTEGTLFVDIDLKGTTNSDQIYIEVNDGTALNKIYIGLYSIYSLFRVVLAGSELVNINNTLAVGNRYKMALTYKSNSVKAFINGSKIGEDTSASIPSCSTINLNTNASGQSYAQVNMQESLVLPTALTDQEAIDLTTI